MPGLKSFFKKNNKESNKFFKLNISNIFVQNEKITTKSSISNNQNLYQKRTHQFTKLFQNEIIDLQKLKKLSWNGIPQCNDILQEAYRSKAWKVLLKYMSSNKDNHEHSLNTKRKDYINMINSYIKNPIIELDQYEKKIIKLIRDDVVRTMPDCPLFRLDRVQQMLQRFKLLLNFRILYIWHIRHPSSGYVQGLNDVATPFLITFISDYIKIDMQKRQIIESLNKIDQATLLNIEADCYWCFTKILNQVLDNYTNSWPGIQKSFTNIKEIINRVDPQLLTHFESKGIDFYHIYFKWVTCLLLRQFSIKIGLRLFDIYITLEASEGNFFKFIQYIFIAIFLKYSARLKKSNFQQLMSFQHKVPTKAWNQEQISTIIAEAFVYQTYFNSQ